MSSTITALTSGGGLAMAGDTSGQLELKTNNGTTAVTINTAQGAQFLNCIGVGNATPSTSGAGITFPATQSASTDANTLDDYEEGTWTPVYTGSTGNPTVTYGSPTAGWYVKVGSQVTAWIQMASSSRSGGSGTLGLSLPFTSNSTSTRYSAGSIGTAYGFIHSSSYLQFGCRVPPNSTSLELWEFAILNSSTSDNPVPVTGLVNASAFLTIMVSYTV